MQGIGIYIDIHSHILPGVDDGAADIEETKHMLRIAYQQGIQSMIATPHFSLRSKRPVSLLRERLQLVQEEAYKIDNNFHIYLGNEIYYEDGCVEAVTEERALTLAGSRYVLVEFSLEVKYSNIYRGMKNFILSGYIPVIAHFERYICLKKRMERVQELIELGCYMQVNADSLIGGSFDFHAAYLKKMVTQRFVHFIATDCHNINSRRPILKKYLEKISKSIDQEDVYQLTYVNPSKIFENKYI